MHEDIHPDVSWPLLHRRGIGRQVRLEFEMLTIADLEHVAEELADKAVKLRKMARNTDLPAFQRILNSRWIMYEFDGRRPPRLRARKPRLILKEVP